MKWNEIGLKQDMDWKINNHDSNDLIIILWNETHTLYEKKKKTEQIE